MRKYTCRFSVLKINSNTYSIILKKSHFFEVIGSYSPSKGSNLFELVFLNKERLFFWLVKGAVAELPVYQFLKIFFKNIMQSKYNFSTEERIEPRHASNKLKNKNKNNSKL